MPYLKKIEIKGFKTFSLKTTIIPSRGLTVITGPNGSGKSNIIDAILFCLGDLSAKRLRVESLLNLIGPKNKSAKVLIQFDNSDQKLPVDTSTVTISREINRKGQSVFRLNGRRISRGNLMEILSMGGIGPHGHNIVLQGTITRLAEITPTERRRMIEDMIGIAQYDAEKAEAEEKLKAADIAIKTVMGRVGEVQRRVEDLERERNDLLRYRFIQAEIQRLDAIRASQNILETKEKIINLKSRINDLEERVCNLKSIRERMREKRREIEAEWRRISSEKGQTELLRVQVEIGDLRTRITEIVARINSSRSTLEGLKRIEENTEKQLGDLNIEIKDINSKIKELYKKRDKILDELEIQEAEYDLYSKDLDKTKENINENRKRLRELENQLTKLGQELVILRSNHAKSRSTISVYTRRLKDLEIRRKEINNSLERLKVSLNDLVKVREDQERRLKVLQETISRRSRQKETAEKELEEAGKIAEVAKDAVIEFSAQREIVEKIRAEEEALKSLEEMGELGVIEGVYGRLRNLIKVEKPFEKAIEAAASGWLDSIVVQDFKAAFACSESLRRLRLGRVKIIPVEGISPLKVDAPQEINGLKGNLLSFIKYPKNLEPAIRFVFGDTFLTVDREAALTLSLKGFRAVTNDGELFEAGGGVESGYYRAPIDLSSIVPSETAIQSLEKAVLALQKHLERRKSEVKEMEKEIPQIQAEASRLKESMARLESEIERVNKSIKMAEENLKIADKNLERLHHLIEKEKGRMRQYKIKRAEIITRERKIRNEIASLRKKVNFSEIRKKEAERESLRYKIDETRQKLNSVEAKISTLKIRLDRILKPALENSRDQLIRTRQQIENLKKEIQKYQNERNKLNNRILKLEQQKNRLEQSLLTIKKEAERFTIQIDNIDEKLNVLDKEYENASNLLNRLKIDFQTLKLRMNNYQQRLKELGYEKPLEVSKEQLEEVDSLLRTMKLELNRIGAVNQLADSQYQEQVSRYKQLSLRINELERERMAIIRFIEEIERKKIQVFMDAFNQINLRLREYFSKLTGGGKAILRLENPDNPFEGGVGMTVEFKGKPPILISGASSGERSVATVAFLLALQKFTPASFYIFDEIDAHLDPFYVEKLGDFLREGTDNAQFLVITLKPEMINKADKVYGVYMHNGASHVITTTFK